MTPKEKAWEIIEKHFNIINKKCNDILDAKMMRKDSFFKSKEHSLILVNYILDETRPDEGFVYWQEVRNEIDKL